MFIPRWRFSDQSLIASSSGRDWGGIHVERRRLFPDEVPMMVSNTVTVIGVAVRGNPDAVLHRRGAGIIQATRAPSGTIWLNPKGVEEDQIRISDGIPEMLLIYLPAILFAQLTTEEGVSATDPALIRYEAGFEDILIGQLGRMIIAEMDNETASGRVLVETCALALVLQLLRTYASGIRITRLANRNALDARRLGRVLAFMEANLDLNFGIEELASVACLSPFHFSRAFRAATGFPPFRYVSRLRLMRAMQLLKEDRMPISQIALLCAFSSQANFTRAFQRATGLPPGRYRHLA